MDTMQTLTFMAGAFVAGVLVGANIEIADLSVLDRIIGIVTVLIIAQVLGVGNGIRRMIRRW